MGVYAITGGSGGIGLRVISQLEKQGHETINIDWTDAFQGKINNIFVLCSGV